MKTKKTKKSKFADVEVYEFIPISVQVIKGVNVVTGITIKESNK